MKLLKYLGIFLLALILTFGAAVYFAPGEVDYNTEVTINAPVSEVWATFQDESQMSKWLQGYKSMKLTKGLNNEVGSEMELIFENEGSEMTMTEVITHYEPEQRFSFDGNFEDQMTFHTDIYMEAIDSNTTKVKSVNHAETHSAIMDLFTWSKENFTKNAQKSYDDLKILVESKQ